jgi:hypothetical protein
VALLFFSNDLRNVHVIHISTGGLKLYICKYVIYLFFNTFTPITHSSNFITHSRTFYFNTPHRRCPYFDVVVGLAWSNDPESYAGSSVPTSRASHARQVKGDNPD